jgi:GDP-L-fucose synthase
VVPALIRKFHEAKEQGSQFVEIWGTGSPMREFLYVDDMAAAALFLMQNYSSREIINVGTGEDVSIRQLAGLIKEVSGFGGEVTFDSSKPDGTPRKLLDVSRIHDLGCRATVPLRDGLERAYAWYVTQNAGSAASARPTAEAAS